jgi:hypothetical protein
MSKTFAGFIMRRYCWLVAGIVVALLFIACEPSWFLSLLTVPSPCSMEGVFTRIHVGMDREEAVKVLRSYVGAIDSAHSSGTLKDGQKFYGGFESLPGPGEATQYTLSLMDEYGEGVEVVVDTDGRVIAKRYSSDLFLDELRVTVRGYLKSRKHTGK